jgi:peptidoglycan hydrolase-like protein with peptidoglycan-binding domain
MAGGTGKRRRRKTARVAIVAATVIVVGAAVAVATGFGLPNGEDSGQARSDLPPKTSAVTRQTLVDTQSESGELGYGDEATVTGKLPGTVTALPASGSTLNRGDALYWVDDTKVVLLYGTLPAYRTLSTGTEGSDVKQFEQNLRALGYTGFTVDDEYSDATATAVKKWQGDLGLSKTGTVEQGRVVYSAGPVRVGTLKAAVGGVAQPGGDVLTYTEMARVIIVVLATSDQRLAVKDAAVSITLPDGKTVPGKIAKTQTVVVPGSDSGGAGGSDDETKIQVSVTTDDAKALDGLDQATVDVAFAASQRENVLTVPVGALLALTEGGYGVQAVDGATTRIVAVKTGLFAAGRVEVSGAGLTEGMTVGMPK